MAHLLVQLVRRSPNPLQCIKMCINNRADHRKRVVRLPITNRLTAHLVPSDQLLRSFLHLLHSLAHLRHIAVQHQQLLVDVVPSLVRESLLVAVQLLLQLLLVTHPPHPHVQQTAQLLLVVLDAHELLSVVRLLRLVLTRRPRPYEHLAQPALQSLQRGEVVVQNPIAGGHLCRQCDELRGLLLELLVPPRQQLAQRRLLRV